MRDIINNTLLIKGVDNNFCHIQLYSLCEPLSEISLQQCTYRNNAPIV